MCNHVSFPYLLLLWLPHSHKSINDCIKSQYFLTDVIFILDRGEINSIYQKCNCQRQFRGDESFGLRSTCYYHIQNMFANKMYTDVKQAIHSQGVPFYFICNCYHRIPYELGPAYISGL